MAPSLAAELATSPVCKVCSYLASLETAAREEWEAELRRPVKAVGNTAVVNALARRNVTVTETSVRRHRSRHAA